MKTFEKITAILSELCEIKEISPKNDLQADLGLDSLQMVTLLMMLEENFEIVLDESDMNPFDLARVEDVIHLVERYTGDENETKD